MCNLTHCVHSVAFQEFMCQEPLAICLYSLNMRVAACDSGTSCAGEQAFDKHEGLRCSGSSRFGALENVQSDFFLGATVASCAEQCHRDPRCTGIEIPRDGAYCQLWLYQNCWDASTLTAAPQFNTFSMRKECLPGMRTVA